MTPLILTAAALWLVVIPAAIYLLLRHDRSQDVAWQAERPERPALPQRRPSDLSAATPLYDAISREFAKAELDDDSLAETLRRWSA